MDAKNGFSIKFYIDLDIRRKKKLNFFWKRRFGGYRKSALRLSPVEKKGPGGAQVGGGARPQFAQNEGTVNFESEISYFQLKNVISLDEWVSMTEREPYIPAFLCFPKFCTKLCACPLTKTLFQVRESFGLIRTFSSSKFRFQ